MGSRDRWVWLCPPLVRVSRFTDIRHLAEATEWGLGAGGSASPGTLACRCPGGQCRKAQAADQPHGWKTTVITTADAHCRTARARLCHVLCGTYEGWGP